MAAKNETVPQGIAGNVAEVRRQAAKSEPKFAIEKLRAKSIQLFGVSQSTFDGAMYGHNEAEYTIKEVKAIIKEWLYGKGGKG